MRALVKTDFGLDRVQLIEQPEPVIAPDEVLIRVAYCAVSSSDQRVSTDAIGCFPPVTLGQQFSGTVERTGADVAGLAAGDHVIAEVHGRTCGRCRYCRSGRRAYCPDKRALGIGTNGAMADFVAVRHEFVHLVPPGIPLREAALVEPAAVCLSALSKRARVEPGDYAMVIGCQFNALATIQLLRALGAGSVIVAGLPEDEEVRIPLACDLGAAKGAILQRTDLADLVMDWTKGVGADLIVDFLGSPTFMDESVPLLRTLGCYCVIGHADTEDLPVPWKRMYQRAVTLFFQYSSDAESCEQTLRFVADGRLKLGKLVSDIFRPEDWREAFAFSRAVEAVKVLIGWNPE